MFSQAATEKLKDFGDFLDDFRAANAHLRPAPGGLLSHYNSEAA
jgi:hypothetical protein